MPTPSLSTEASDGLLRRILTETKTIALVGASDKPHRASNGVMRFLQGRGYRVIPVNPTLAGKQLNGELVYAGLKDIPQDKTGRIDMVDIFRNSADAAAPTLEAIEIGAKFVWMQLDVVNELAATKARDAGLEVVMDRCPAIEHPRLMRGPTDH